MLSVFWYKRCVSGVLVALVHFGCDINCCVELHVGEKNGLNNFEKVNSVERNVLSIAKNY